MWGRLKRFLFGEPITIGSEWVIANRNPFKEDKIYTVVAMKRGWIRVHSMYADSKRHGGEYELDLSTFRKVMSPI